MALDLGFGFNDANFSDRILRIVILPDDHDHKPSSESQPDEHDDDSRKPVCDDLLQVSTDMHTGEASKKKTYSDQLHVNSLILAAHSPFFHKLFSNGMKETGQKQATIHIQALEEAAFMDMLKFMYSNKLSSATPAELVEVLKIADKYSVPSCIKLCHQLLVNLPMTIELALLYLDLDLTGLLVDSVTHRFDTAKEFLVEHFKNMRYEPELKEEFLMLPLVGVEVVLSSDYLRLVSEDDVYYWIWSWVRRHYGVELLELDGRKTLNMLLRRFLRFPFISIRTLEVILSCEDIDPDVSSEIALGSLGYNLARPPQKQAPDKYIKRAYTNRHLKVVAFDESSSNPQCIVYLDLKRGECEKVTPDGYTFSQTFFLGEHELFLCIVKTEVSEISYFGLFFGTPDHETSKTAGLTISSEIASMQKPSDDFVRILKQDITIPKDGSYCGWKSLFGIPWKTFIKENSPYFINDILRLRCHIRLKN